MIVWNKVTWYSRYLALIFFTILFPLWAFYLGTEYQKTLSEIYYSEASIPVVLIASTTPVKNSPTTTLEVIDSGIKGKVTIGPTCPVEMNPPDPKCDPKPYAASLVAINRITAEKKEFKVSDDGSFNIKLSPGDYSIRNVDSSVLPRMEDQEISVYAHKYTQVNIEFDSGIR
jgi:hypothetical protein